MRILLQLRSDNARFPGGDFVAAEKLRDELSRLDVDCTINSDYHADLNGFDLIQIYNTTRAHEPMLFLENARKHRVPCILVPTWHSAAEMGRFYTQLYGFRNFPMHLYLGAKEVHYGFRSRVFKGLFQAVNHRRNARKIISEADMVIANSKAELNFLESELDVRPNAARIIYNAVDFSKVPKSDLTGRKDIYCVGRIEPRKNQLKVIDAFKKADLAEHKLCFIGSFNSAHKKYTDQFQSQLVPGRIVYLGAKSQEELFQIFSRAKSVVSASYFETTALVGLEAMACGANVTISDSPYSREYYREFADYLDPYSVDSIAFAMRKSLSREFQPCKEHLEQFRWQNVVHEFLNAYHDLSLTR